MLNRVKWVAGLGSGVVWLTTDR